MSNRLSKDCILTTLGMAFFWPAIHNQVLYPLTLTFNKTDAWPAFYFYLVYALIAIVTSLILAASRLRKANILDRRAPILAFGVIGILGFAAMAFFGFEGSASTAAIGAGAAMYAVFVPMYFTFWSIRIIGNARDVIVTTAASYLIACLLQTLRLALGIHTVAFGFGCTVLSVACAGFVTLTPIMAPNNKPLRSLRAYPFKLIGLAFFLICLLLIGIALTNPPMAANSYPPATRVVMYAGCAVMCTVIIAIRCRGSHDPDRAAMLTIAFLAMVTIICILVTGFALVPFSYVGNFPLIGCKIVIEMFIWALVLLNAKSKRLHLSVIMCIYLIVVIFIPNLISATTLHLGLFESAEDTMLLVTMVLAALIICIALNLVLAALLFDSKPANRSSGSTHVALGMDAAETNPLESAFDSFRNEYNLSERQMDVVRLAYRNWTSKRIGEELFISESTVKTHLKAIYKNADLHSKQGLIDAIDARKGAIGNVQEQSK